MDDSQTGKHKSAQENQSEPSSEPDQKRQKNAFSEIMKPKPAAGGRHGGGGGNSHGKSRSRGFHGIDALGAYIAHPESYLLGGGGHQDSHFPSGQRQLGSSSSHHDGHHDNSSHSHDHDLGGRVIFYDDKFVAIHDKFPKASVHCLLLPRHPRFNRRPPLEVLSGQSPEERQFLADVRAGARRLQKIVASELRRRYGRESAQDAEREAVLRGDMPVDWGQGKNGAEKMRLPEGRDWEAEVLVGIHAVPSMSHLHVHVLSRDMYSDHLRHRSHYNSFTTPFFVPLESFPIARAAQEAHASLVLSQMEMRCWRCGQRFGSRFADLRRHLAQEFAAWKQQ